MEFPSDAEGLELRGILDEEIGRLPEKYRRPVVLCYLEGQTHEQAVRLRCTEGAVRGRLDRVARAAQDSADPPRSRSIRRLDRLGPGR